MRRSSGSGSGSGNDGVDTPSRSDGGEVFSVYSLTGAAREDCARCLAEQAKALDAWARQVPRGYYVPRTEGQPFSTDANSTLDLSHNPNILIHCQRQRLLLELYYHYQCLGLFQPFFGFAAAATAEASTPVADGNAATALHHAMTLTRLLHQALAMRAEALSGVYHVVRWQKMALFTMIAYAYAFPLSPARDSIRAAVDQAIAVIGRYRHVLPDAAAVTRTACALQRDVAAVVDGFHAGSHWSPATLPPYRHQPAALDLVALDTNGAPPPFDFAAMDLDMTFPLPSLSEGEANWDTADTLWTNRDPFGWDGDAASSGPPLESWAASAGRVIAGPDPPSWTERNMG